MSDACPACRQRRLKAAAADTGRASGFDRHVRLRCLFCNPSPCVCLQAEDIKKVADYVSQLRRVGKGHGEWGEGRELRPAALVGARSRSEAQLSLSRLKSSGLLPLGGTGCQRGCG